MNVVSIVVATYNRTAFLRETLMSLINQTYPATEIILVDDGSTDGTQKYIKQLLKEKKFADKISFFPRSKNEGVSSAMNFGMSQATGTYIAHIGSDDIWAPTNLEKQVELLEKNSEVGLTYSDVARIDQNNSILATSRFVENKIGPHRGWVLDKLLFKGMFIPAISVVFRRELFQEVGGFDKSIQISNDFDFFIKVSAHCQVDYIPEVLGFWRMHSQNLHNKDRSKMYQERMQVITSNYKRFKSKHDLSMISLGITVSNTMAQLGREQFVNKNSFQARITLLGALLYFPVNPVVWLFLLNTFLDIEYFWDIDRLKSLYMRIF